MLPVRACRLEALLQAAWRAQPFDTRTSNRASLLETVSDGCRTLSDTVGLLDCRTLSDCRSYVGVMSESYVGLSYRGSRSEEVQVEEVGLNSQLGCGSAKLEA